MLASHRAPCEIASGGPLTIDRDNDKETRSSRLREIAEENPVGIRASGADDREPPAQIEVDEPEEDSMALLMGARGPTKPADDDLSEEETSPCAHGSAGSASNGAFARCGAGMIDADDLITLVRNYNPKSNAGLLRDGVRLSERRRITASLRHSGEPYFSPPVGRWPAILAEMQLDDATLITALLHDTIEDHKTHLLAT